MLDEGAKGFKGGMNARKYIGITKISKATATRDMQQLLEIGAFVFAGTAGAQHQLPGKFILALSNLSADVFRLYKIGCLQNTRLIHTCQRSVKILQVIKFPVFVMAYFAIQVIGLYIQFI